MYMIDPAHLTKVCTIYSGLYLYTEFCYCRSNNM